MAIRRIVIDHVLFVVEDFDANRRLYTAAPVPDARALALTALLVGQTLMVLVERSPGVPVWRTGLRGNRALLPLLAAILATLAAALYVPPLADLLRISPLPFAGWGTAAGVAAATTLWLEPFKLHRDHPSRPSD